MPKPLAEVLRLLDELRAWQEEAASDPKGAGRRLKQPIINLASALASSTGDFYPLMPAGVNDRDSVEQHKAEARRIKSEAQEIRLWARDNLPTGPA